MQLTHSIWNIPRLCAAMLTHRTVPGWPLCRHMTQDISHSSWAVMIEVMPATAGGLIFRLEPLVTYEGCGLGALTAGSIELLGHLCAGGFIGPSWLLSLVAAAAAVLGGCILSLMAAATDTVP